MTTRAALTKLSPQERRIRIELLRLRAAYQRVEMQRTARHIGDELQPRAIAAEAREGLKSMGLGWVSHGLRTLRRFPVLLSLASTLLSGARRRRMLLRAALAGGLFLLGKHQLEKSRAVRLG